MKETLEIFRAQGKFIYEVWSSDGRTEITLVRKKEITAEDVKESSLSTQYFAIVEIFNELVDSAALSREDSLKYEHNMMRPHRIGRIEVPYWISEHAKELWDAKMDTTFMYHGKSARLRVPICSIQNAVDFVNVLVALKTGEQFVIEKELIKGL